jgi:hypothetical protein
MFCPRCGTTQNDDWKFCKSCGANLQAVRQVVDNREESEKWDWGKTWVGEMFMSEQESARRKAEYERLTGITPEVKRYNEIKGGVIAASVGLAVAIFLSVLMEGIIAGGKVPPEAVPILSSLWVSGLVPFFIGLAVIINGVFVSKRIVEASRREEQSNLLGGEGSPRSLRAADTSEFIPPGFSVTEQTTKHLSGTSKR